MRKSSGKIAEQFGEQFAQRLQKFFSNPKEKILRFLLRKKQKKTISAEQKKNTARMSALKTIEALRKNKDKQKLVIQLADIVSEFYRQYLGITYSFTNEELADELLRRKIDKYLKRKSVRLLQRVAEAKYNVNHSNEEINALVEDAKEIIELL